MFRAPCFLEALRIKRRLLGIEFMAVILVHPLDDNTILTWMTGDQCVLATQ